MVHLHARNHIDETPAFEKEIYQEIIAGIRSKNVSIPICVSTSGRDFNEFWKRSDVLKLKPPYKPDFASLTLGSFNFLKQTSVNTPETIKALLTMMIDNGIKPEFEIFDTGMIHYGKYLIKEFSLAPPYYFNFIFGNISTAQANIKCLSHAIMDLPDGALWTAGGIGSTQLKMNVMGLLSGGGVRVGLEDCIWMDKQKREPATNKCLVERIVRLGQNARIRTLYAPLRLESFLSCRKNLQLPTELKANKQKGLT